VSLTVHSTHATSTAIFAVNISYQTRAFLIYRMSPEGSPTPLHDTLNSE